MTVIAEVGDWSDGEPVHSYFVCEVFASRPVEGNQLAVFVDGPLALRYRSPAIRCSAPRSSSGVRSAGTP